MIPHPAVPILIPNQPPMATSPFPFSYSAPLAFPYAATYPCPPPASAYTPASGFSPTWPTWPPPSLDPTPSTAPPTFSSFPASTFAVPTTTPNLFGAPAPVSFPAPAYGSSDVPPADTPSTAVHLPVQGTPQPTAVPTAPDREDTPPQRHASTPAVDSARFSQSSPAGMSATLLRCPDQVPGAPLATDLSKPNTSPATPNRSSMGSSSSVSARSTITQVDAPTDSTAVDADGSIPTEMEFVLTELRGACGLRPRSSPATTTSTPTFASVSATSPSDVLSATNSVAPRVFGEKPTPRYLHGTQATTLNCCDGHQNLMRSPYVQGGSTNLREQYVDEVPKSYGFNNLSSQSLFLADGTERRYFALPEDYPLEQVTPPMPYSAVEKVGVPSVAAQAAGLAPVLCSKANITAGSELLVPNLQQPLNVQDASRVFMEMPVYDIYEEENSYLNCTDEQLAKRFYKATENASNGQISVFKHPCDPEINIGCSSKLYTGNYIMEFLIADSSLAFQQAQLQQIQTQECHMILRTEGIQEWDPGIKTPSFMDLCLYWPQDIKFNGIDLWMFHFLPP